MANHNWRMCKRHPECEAAFEAETAYLEAFEPNQRAEYDDDDLDDLYADTRRTSAIASRMPEPDQADAVAEMDDSRVSYEIQAAR